MHNKFFGVVAIFLIQWQTNAQTLTKTQLATAPEPSVYSNIEWIDLDADGDMDFIALFSDPNDDANSFVKVYQNANGAYTEQPGAFGSSSMDPRSYAFNDGDGDGDIDLLFLDNEGVKIAANNGDFTFVIQYTTVSNPSNLRVEIHWQDLDGDLDLDIVFDTFTYMNIEGVHHPALHNMPPYTRNRSWADVDNDGYLDMVATKGQSQGVNPLFLFLNQGDGLFKEKEKLSPGFLDGGQTQWLDADADHDLDLFITEEGEKSTLLENVFIESGTVGFQEVVSFKTLSNTKADVGDLDLDGLPDIIITGQGFPRFETYLYRNTSTAGEINFAESNLQINPYLVSNFKLVDIDSDSDLDLFILGWDDDAYSIRAQNVYNVIPGSSRPVPAVPANLASAVGEVVTLSWEDSNEGTVFFDLSITLDGVPFNPGLATSSGWFLMPDILALQNTSNVTLQNLPPGSYQWKVQAFDHAYRASGFSGSSAFTVIEAPGSLSLVMQAYNRVDIAWQYSGTATEFSVQRRSTNSALSEIGRVAGNTMTFTDAAVPPNEHVEYVIKAIKNGSYSAPSHSVAFYSAQFDEIPFNPAGPNIIAASGISADLDQDQDFDLAFVGRVDDEYSTSISLRNNGAGVYSEAAFLPGAEELGEPIVSRDLDNDGDIDIVAVVGTAGAGFKVAVYKNNGTAVFTKSFETVAYPGISQVVSEDMNQDGLPDLMINRTLGNNAANPPTYELLYQTAAGSFVDSKVNFLTDDTSTIGLGDFHLADMNNDGFTDVVFSGGYNVNAKLFLNLKGDAFREESFGLTSLTDPAFFDFNGDGVLDVLQRGFQVLYLHNGLGGAQFG
ncbi:MAG TPA: VCBS repeat-containing protein, partial [Chryseolinea sp.]